MKNYNLPDVIFLLYGGSSADGLGPGVYEGRTADPVLAFKFWEQLVDNPYSTGSVVVITPTHKETISSWKGDLKRWDRYRHTEIDCGEL